MAAPLLQTQVLTLLSWLQNQNERGVPCHYQVQLARYSGHSEWKSD